jgi:hypothetical protein
LVEFLLSRSSRSAIRRSKEGAIPKSGDEEKLGG